MKIGILLLAYNSERWIDSCIAPWLLMKKNGWDVVIGCSSGMYRDYYDLGFEPKNCATIEKLIKYNLDVLINFNPPSLIDENTSRNTILNMFKNSVDIVWILDSDEVYTESEILSILNFVETTPQYDWYSISFKNYVFTESTWVYGFCPPRIFRTDRYGGLSHFYFDNHIQYNDGSVFEDKKNIAVPRDIAWVNHYSWLNDDSRSKEKVKYQNIRFINGCSFDWDDSNNRLKFSENFYAKVGLGMPILHESTETVCNDFIITYDRSEKTFYIQDVTKKMTATFRFYNGYNNSLIYEVNMTVEPGVNYFCSPPQHAIDEEIKKFKIEVIHNLSLLHCEILHI